MRTSAWGPFFQQHKRLRGTQLVWESCLNMGFQKNYTESIFGLVDPKSVLKKSICSVASNYYDFNFSRHDTNTWLTKENWTNRRNRAGGKTSIFDGNISTLLPGIDWRKIMSSCGLLFVATIFANIDLKHGTSFMTFIAMLVHLFGGLIHNCQRCSRNVYELPIWDFPEKQKLRVVSLEQHRYAGWYITSPVQSCPARPSKVHCSGRVRHSTDLFTWHSQFVYLCQEEREPFFVRTQSRYNDFFSTKCFQKLSAVVICNTSIHLWLSSKYTICQHVAAGGHQIIGKSLSGFMFQLTTMWGGKGAIISNGSANWLPLTLAPVWADDRSLDWLLNACATSGSISWRQWRCK